MPKEQAAFGSVKPAFRSMALRELPKPDFVDLAAVALPPRATTDPVTWAEALFAAESWPVWMRLAFRLREVLVPLVGIGKGDPAVFKVQATAGDEALIRADEAHLDFRAAVGVDTDQALVRVTTVVKLNGWRGRLYFAPVKLVHPIMVQAMLRRAALRLAGSRGSGQRQGVPTCS
jgi:hypothetical protein